MTFETHCKQHKAFTNKGRGEACETPRRGTNVDIVLADLGYVELAWPERFLWEPLPSDQSVPIRTSLYRPRHVMSCLVLS